MDPYLESPAIWSDFHLTMIVTLRTELNRRLPPRYAASADRYVWIREPDNGGRTLLGKPDVYVTEDQQPPTRSAAPRTLAAPVRVVLPGVREKGSPYLRIVDLRDRRLVTVLELLSPANKTPGKDRNAYLMKREEYLATGVNLVELDLLREGERAPMGSPAPPPTNYYVLVCRASELPAAGIWPFSVCDPLPPLTVPLSGEDADIHFPLQPCMDRAYDDAGYAREIDYRQPPRPSLQEPDATWARELLAGKTGSIHATPPTSGEHP